MACWDEQVNGVELADPKSCPVSSHMDDRKFIYIWRVLKNSSSHQHSNTAAFNWILNRIHYLSIFPVMSDSNMLFISHLSGLRARWEAEGTRGILGRRPRSAEHYKFQTYPHSPSELIYLLLASSLLCTHYYCKIFVLERFKGKRCYVLVFVVLPFFP